MRFAVFVTYDVTQRGPARLAASFFENGDKQKIENTAHLTYADLTMLCLALFEHHRTSHGTHLA